MGLRPILDADTPNPLIREKSSELEVFFYDEPPVRWLPEVYAELHGGDTKGFVDGVRHMSTWGRFPLRSSTRTLLEHCESDYGKKQLALLVSFFTFQVVSDYLAINAGSCSADQLKDDLYPSGARKDSGNPGSHTTADIDYEDQETPPPKKARVGQVTTHRSHLSPTTEDGYNTTGSPLAPRARSLKPISPAALLAGGSAPASPDYNLRDGYTLPPWAKDRPLHTFKLQLLDDWGPRLTGLYEAAKTKPVLDHTHVDEIALLSGILHLNKNHVGFTGQEVKKISREVLQKFYSREKEDEDIQRSQDAALLWTSWVQKWKSLLLNEKVAAQRDDRDPAKVVNTEPVVEAILSSYADCRSKNITSIFFIALHVFREYNNWAAMVSESDCLMAVVGPILKEIMSLQHKIKFTCANACTSVGKTRKATLKQDGQSRQPDVIGQTEDKDGKAVNTDILRLAIFSKDSLDVLHNTLEQGPPLLTFQTVGLDVTFFLGTKINNTIVHIQLSTVKLPSRLTELDLDHDFFFHLFQVQTLINITNDRLENKRDEPLQEIFFPTLGTPERNAALKSPLKRATA
ncbi:hypothetical protein KI688_002752 [Linnemannia hyalina]|uniref:Uncharacterized protein n=1 Tax=Linnemannia hyalina TaxID=64524 RepID=A0A9P8BTZ4_9FUNG|nr:hypothetical protein KI688_002752 [Linnemannia hyalina]